MAQGEPLMGDWTAHTTDRLRDLWSEGPSCSQIAGILSDETGQGFTRNAIIGKAHRLGLVARATGTTPNEKRLSAGTLGGKRSARTAPRPVVVVPPPPPQASPLNLTFMQLDNPGTQRMCRYPIGDPRGQATLYCGAETTAPGQPYCSAHKALCWTTAPRGEPRAMPSFSMRRSA